MKKNKPDIEMCGRVSSILKTLSHPQRLFILCNLYFKDMTVTELENCCDVSQPQISQHLTRMRLEGLIDSEREGNFVSYRITDPRIRVLLEAFEKVFDGK